MHELDLEKKIVAISALLADRARTCILFLLMDGRAYTATELSVAADIAPSTASAHLSRLVEQNIVTCIKQGRYRYFKIFSEEVAILLESMMCFVNSDNFGTVKTSTPKSLRSFRTCYNHMAGEVAVKIHNSLRSNLWITDDYHLTSNGKEFFFSLGIDCDTKTVTERKFACSCLDWSERYFHLGGFLGALLHNHFLQKKWAIRQLDSRELKLTESGKRVLKQRFNIEI
ncbi:ArsR/SmtB family transcription factor [Xenorhabdus innexi]|uniref:ArsR family transcriptional regulator n=1 Tax=Xenorhabdus innexi TaxID=290109 RepID=A0A1N6MW99_9GAMM|nr:winged helix-turn-helix domain-containing protein [Xenorhabdus innexi]PHM30990.1 ArsR family transcriptional regulator [Xenorhabdus innexi]SIP73100.1 putative transcriptional regulator [Xenorhabdus innexi]